MTAPNDTPAAWCRACGQRRRDYEGRGRYEPACPSCGDTRYRPVLAKPTRTQLRAKCDRLFSAHIRSHGECEAQGADGISCSDRMQCAHVLSRKHLAVRWNPLNALCLCSAHHVFYTHHELHWERWRDSYLGHEVLEKLRHQAITQAGPPNYERILGELLAGSRRPPEREVAS